MKIELANPNKVPICFVGKYLFTYENPEHLIDIDTLTNQQKQQLLFSLQRGVLKTPDTHRIQELIPKPVAPTIEEVVKPSFNKQEDDTMLRKLLNKSAVSIKKESTDLRLSQIRRILEIESQNKNRKTLIKFLNDLVLKHQKEVANKLGTEDLEVQLEDIGDNQISAIEESEQKEVTVELPT